MSPSESTSFGRDMAKEYLRIPCPQRPSIDCAVKTHTAGMDDMEFIAFVDGFFEILNEHDMRVTTRH
jgi:hypothetical protein